MPYTKQAVKEYKVSVQRVRKLLFHLNCGDAFHKIKMFAYYKRWTAKILEMKSTPGNFYYDVMLFLLSCLF